MAHECWAFRCWGCMGSACGEGLTWCNWVRMNEQQPRMMRTVTIYNTHIPWAWELWRMTPSRGYPLTYSPVSLSGFLVGTVYLRPEGWLNAVAGANGMGCGVVEGHAGRGSWSSTSVRWWETLECMKWFCDTNQFTNMSNGLVWCVRVWSWGCTKGNGRVKRCVKLG